jgi:glycosyltransferase involved in cell wall biosynthesis
MIDATIVIPTNAHPELLPYALRSALAQEDAEVEVFVVGDGAADDTREALHTFSGERRLRFFDNAKGERHGEAHRHAALQHAAGKVVCYLSDDDLLLPDHVATMLELLAGADFAHAAPFSVQLDGTFVFMPVDVADPGYQTRLAHGRWNAIGLTGASHTLDAYRRLPRGWHPAPDDVWTDLHMWRQFLALPGFRGTSGTRPTMLHFPSPGRAQLSSGERVDELARWEARLQSPGFREEIERAASRGAQRSAVSRDAHASHLEQLTTHLEQLGRAAELEARTLREAIAEIRATRTWRAREALLRFGLARALLARSPGGR